MTVELSTLGSVIKTALEAESDTNTVTDAEKTVIGNTSGTNTGDQTNITGNAATVTTNANLTGHVTSVGNAAVLGAFTKAQLNTAVSDGTPLYSGDVTTNATHTGDVTGATSLTIDPSAISGKALATAVSGDFALILDTSVSPNALKKANVSDFLAGTGDLLADGTIPLTANWDVGSFQIRAETFQSDIATGTAPFTVASQTVVTNLNASLLEGNAASAFATAAQGTTADAALPKAGGQMTGNVTCAGAETFDGRDLSVDGAKLDGIEASATADQTGAEIKTAYEAEADTNAFTDADHSKLDGIEASADVTDATNVASSGAVMADGTGNDITGDLVMTEKADHSSTPSAGKGYLWTKSDTPSSLIFTDDAGTDYDLTAAGGGWADMTEAVWAGGTQSEVADGASAVAFDFDTDNAYSTSGANLVRFSNNGTDVFDFSYQGGIDHANSGATTAAHSQSLNLNWEASSAQTSSGQYTTTIGRNNTASSTYAATIGNANQATGNACIAMGNGNSASGNQAVAMGNNCTAVTRSAAFGDATIADGVNSFAAGNRSDASAGYSVALGQRSVATNSGELAVSSGRFSVNGDSQWSMLNVSAETTDATQTTMQANSTDIVIPADTTWAFCILIAARSDETDGNDSAIYKIEGGLTRDESNNTSIVGTITKTVIAEDAGASAWDVTAEADDTNEALAIKVTGEASTNIRWVAKVDIAQVTYA